MFRYIAQLVARAAALPAGLAASLMLALGPALAADSSDYKVADGLAVYYAVLPAEMIRTYPESSPEGRMHGGVPGGKHVHHIQVALFDVRTNERISDARVTATVAEPGLGGQTISLEPFMVGDALTYGNYFEFSKLADYTVTIGVERTGSNKRSEIGFEYRHH